MDIEPADTPQVSQPFIQRKARQGIQLLEIHLMRWAFGLAMLYAAPSLFFVFDMATVSLVTQKPSAGVQKTDFAVGTFAFSLLGVVLLGFTVAGATFTYAGASDNPEITRHLRQAGKRLYICMMCVICIMALAFALNIYQIALHDLAIAGLPMWVYLAMLGYILTSLCAGLGILKLIQFATALFKALQLEAREGS